MKKRVWRSWAIPIICTLFLLIWQLILPEIYAFRSQEQGDHVAVIGVNIEIPNVVLQTDIDTISVKEMLQLYGSSEKIYLFSTFDHPSNSVVKLRQKIPDLLQAMGNEYHLDELSDINLETYHEKTADFCDFIQQKYGDRNVEEYSELHRQVRILREFHKVYRNAERNREILAFVENENNQYRRGQGFDMAELSKMLPHDSDLYKRLWT